MFSTGIYTCNTVLDQGLREAFVVKGERASGG
jgi:hypothetical protein